MWSVVEFKRSMAPKKSRDVHDATMTQIGISYGEKEIPD